MIWSQAEVCALIVCSCVPSLRILFRRVPALVPVRSAESQAHQHLRNGFGLAIGLRGGRRKALGGGARLTFEDKQAWLSSAATVACRPLSRGRGTFGSNKVKSGSGMSKTGRTSGSGSTLVGDERTRIGTTIRVESRRGSENEEMMMEAVAAAEGQVGILVIHEVSRHSHGMMYDEGEGLARPGAERMWTSPV
jgi:hypothetical protein